MNSNIILQIERTIGGSLAPDMAITFDQPVYENGDISYTSGASEVVINQTGRYLAQWWVATQSIPASQGAVFELSGSNITPTNPFYANSPIKTGETVGIAVFDVTQVPAMLSVINKSTTEVWFSSAVSVKACLRVHSHHELENIDDGNAPGSLIGIGAATGYTMGNYAIALGLDSIASGDYSSAGGYVTEASGTAAHSQGGETHAGAIFSHAEGYRSVSLGDFSHAEGSNTQALGSASHAEGLSSQALGDYAHAEGSGTTASGNSSHAEGDATESSGLMSHAEGFQTVASQWASHAEGTGTQATQSHAHAEGYYTIASGNASHAEGEFTSTNLYQGAHIMGRYGDAEMDYSWFLANGTDENNKGLAAKIQADGNAYIDIAWNSGGADYAEMFETANGEHIEPGYFITIDSNGKIRIAQDGTQDYILGVSSAVPSVVGNAGELRWKEKYKTDEWGRIEYSTVTIPAKLGRDGAVLSPMRVEKQPVLNPQWNPRQEYIPRRKRSEWVPVGLLGQILVRDDGTCISGGYCSAGKGGIATGAQLGYRVIRRTSAKQILILFR